MVSKNVNKVQKHIAKKKGKNAPLHENSRDSRRLARAGAREDKLHRLSSGRAKLNTPYRASNVLMQILFLPRTTTTSG